MLRRSWRTLGAKRQLTFCYIVCYVSMGWSVGCYGPALLRMANAIGLDHATVGSMGWVGTARGFGWMTGSCLAGGVLDKTSRAGGRRGSHGIVASSIVVGSLALAMTTQATSMWHLVLLAVVNGTAFGCLDTVLNTLVVWLWGDAVGPYMQALHAGFGVGVFSSPFAVALDLHLHRSYVASFCFLSVMSCACAALPLAFTSPRDPLHLHLTDIATSSGAAGGCVVLDDDAASKVQVQVPGPPSSSSSSSSSSSPPLRSPTSRFRLVRLEWIVKMSTATLLLFYVGAEVGLGLWLSPFAVKAGFLPETMAAILVSCYWGTFTLGRVLGVCLATRFPPHQLLICDFCGAFVALMLLILGDVTKQVGLVWLGAALAGLAMASVFPLGIGLPPILDVPVSGTATAIFVTGASIGDMLVPMFMGIAFSARGPGWILAVAVCSLLGAALACYLAFWAGGQLNKIKARGIGLGNKDRLELHPIGMRGRGKDEGAAKGRGTALLRRSTHQEATLLTSKSQRNPLHHHHHAARIGSDNGEDTRRLHVHTTAAAADATGADGVELRTRSGGDGYDGAADDGGEHHHDDGQQQLQRTAFGARRV